MCQERKISAQLQPPTKTFNMSDDELDDFFNEVDEAEDQAKSDEKEVQVQLESPKRDEIKNNSKAVEETQQQNDEKDDNDETTTSDNALPEKKKQKLSNDISTSEAVTIAALNSSASSPKKIVASSKTTSAAPISYASAPPTQYIINNTSLNNGIIGQQTAPPPPPPPPPLPPGPVPNNSLYPNQHGNNPYHQQNTTTNNNKNKNNSTKRSAAGKTWEDPTLAEFPPNDFRLFVGNLSKDIHPQQLENCFKVYPSFAMARICYNKHDGKSRGYGFVSMLDPLDAARAAREMDQKWLGARPMKVKMSNTTKGKRPKRKY